MCSTRDTVTFRHSFTIRGLEGMQPSGDYTVVTEEEEIPGLSFQAWRRVSTQIYLPAIGAQSAQEQASTIDPRDLAHALESDRGELVQ